MTLLELLSRLRRLDVKLWVEDDRLRFSAPESALTPTDLVEIAERETEILAFLYHADAVVHMPGPPIVPISHKRNPQLSFAQERLWFLEQLLPDTSAYNMPAAFRLTGPLDVAALRQSLDELVRRHESLRTSFATEDGQPVQVIAPTPALSLPIVDLHLLSESQREAQTMELATQEARRPFDLGQGPLLRPTLIRLEQDDHVLLLTMHHIVSDGWSIGVLNREIVALYRAFSSGEPSPLPELPVQYADFAVWQRDWLQGEVLETQLSYWKQQLEGAPPVLELPADRPRPPVETLRGATSPVELPRALSEGLEALSQREGVTLFMTLLAAFQAMLYRYTGQDDIVVGSPIANRNRSEIEGLIGFFVNTLVMRTDLSGDPSFRELLGRVREVSLGAYAHQDLPFEKLVDELEPERDLSRNPLFQVSFALQNAPTEPMELPGLSLRPIGVDTHTSKFDLSLSLREGEEGLQGYLEYNTDLFDAPTVERMSGHLKTVLEGIVADPERRLSELPLLTEAESHQVLVEWNDTRTDYPSDRCIHELFEEQVDRSPDAIAVVFEDEQLTYGELNRRANQLAHYLRGLGVGPEVLVGICMERSVEMVVAILGILKAGGAYVPLDPEYPKERLTFMIDDSQVPILLTQEPFVETLPGQRANVVCLDQGWDRIGQESRENPAVWGTPQNLAYVIYTSGSTGTPKGVTVAHYNVTRLFEATQPWFHFDESDAWTLFHSSTFDFSVWELWGSLQFGGKLVVIPYWISRSPEEFYDLLIREGVTVLNQTPSAFLQLLGASQRNRDSEPGWACRLLISGGEALDVSSLTPWFDGDQEDRTRFVNMYGITETTVHATYRPIVSQDLGDKLGSPIGRPISDLQSYVLDPRMKSVPIGVPGEIHIGGAGLARGYLNRPDLTAEKFIPNAFSDEPGARLYRTGDLARYLPDGNIEFLGRIDHQVKIRGYRIELGEVEAVLAQHPGVKETVALAREDTPGDKRLVAYVVPDEEPPPSSNQLLIFLKEKLPEYMVPSVFVTLDTLPFTPNGKVDRRVLPAPDKTRPELDRSYVPPRTPVEGILVEYWCEVLGVNRVGVHDNFFELGGDSLSLARVHGHLLEAWDENIPMVEMFKYSTIGLLAEHLRSEIGEPILDAKSKDRAGFRRGFLKQQQVLRQKRQLARRGIGGR